MNNNNIWIVIEREYMTRVRRKSFIVMTLIGPLLMLLLMFGPALIMTYGGEDEQVIAVLDHTGLYGDVLKIMRAFVRKEVLPDEKTYTEVIGNDNEIVKSAFEELSKLLLVDSKTTQKFLKKHKHESVEDMDYVWEELCEELLRKEKAIELDWKERKDEFFDKISEEQFKETVKFEILENKKRAEALLFIQLNYLAIFAKYSRVRTSCEV